MTEIEISEILKKSKSSEILHIYEYETVPHIFTERNNSNKYYHRYGNRERLGNYSLNYLSYLFLKIQLNDNLYTKIANHPDKLLNVNTPAAIYESFHASRDQRNISDIFAKVLLLPDNFPNNNSKYIKQLFESEEFYQNKEKDSFYFKRVEHFGYRNIDFGKYAFSSLNPLALNHIYLEVKECKNEYQDFVFNTFNRDQLKKVLTHYKNKNECWSTIKPIDNLFFSIDFLLLFANSTILNDKQLSLLNFLFEDDKLLQKVKNNAGKYNIYTKDKHYQRNSKDLFLNALLNENTAFINLLLKYGYEPNTNEIALLKSSPIEDKIESSELLCINNLEQVTQNLLDHISNSNKEIQYVYDLTSNDISVLQKDYNSFKHSVFLKKTFNSNLKHVSFYNNSLIHVIDLIILDNAYSLPALNSKGFKHINPYVEEIAFKEMLINKYIKLINSDTIQDSLNYIDDYLNKQNDNGITIISETFNQFNNTNKYLNPFFDYFIANKIKDIIFKDEEKAYYASISIAIFNSLKKEEAESIFKNELSALVSEFTLNYIQTLAIHYDNINIVQRDILIDSLAKLSINYNEVFTTIQEAKDTGRTKRYYEILLLLENKHLNILANSNNNMVSKISKRL